MMVDIKGCLVVLALAGFACFVIYAVVSTVAGWL